MYKQGLQYLEKLSLKDQNWTAKSLFHTEEPDEKRSYLSGLFKCLFYLWNQEAMIYPMPFLIIPLKST